MTYKLNTLGRETIRNFVRTNADSNKCMGEYFEEAEKSAKARSLVLEEGLMVVRLEPQYTVHRRPVSLILGAEHYDNV